MGYIDNTTAMAMKMYTAYCEGVGGRAYNGDLLPGANEFFSDPAKQVQVTGWKDAAKAAKEFVIEQI